MENITIISSSKNWLEQDAIIQLKKTASLPGIIKAVGLPDLHPGKTPVGAVFISNEIIYPHIIGNDIGCGMSMFMTNMATKKTKLPKILRKLETFKSLHEVNISDTVKIDDYPLSSSLGTIGGGNHFAEFQEIHKVYDTETFSNLGFDKTRLFLLVHSGSRGYGQEILDTFIRNHQVQNGLIANSEAFVNYMERHNDAVKWAVLNRELISYRLLKASGVPTEAVKLIDICHNILSEKKFADSTQYIHRKGASPADEGAVIIPGSRGSLSYLVMPVEDTSASGYSLAHGAGRKWQRSLCKSRLQNLYTKKTIRNTKLRGVVICNDTNLLYEEAEEAYKNIETVIQSLIDFGLIKVIATFKPLLTYKG